MSDERTREAEIVAAHLLSKPPCAAHLTCGALEDASETVQELLDDDHGAFPGGITLLHQPLARSGQELAKALLDGLDASQPCLVVVQDVKVRQAGLVSSVINEIWQEHPGLRVIVTSTVSLALRSQHRAWLRLDLGAVDIEALNQTWAARSALETTARVLANARLSRIRAIRTPTPPPTRDGTGFLGRVTDDINVRLGEIAAAELGSSDPQALEPLLAERDQLEAVLDALDEGPEADRRIVWRDLQQDLVDPVLNQITRTIAEIDEAMLHSQEQMVPVLLGPDGHPVEDSNRDFRALEISFKAVSSELFDVLARRPELLYDLSPRKFEELMAELYAMQGFDVELTRATKDNGIDLFLVRHEAYGRVLTIADCKRYAPDRPAGVGLVRQMHGLIEANRANAGLIVTTSYFTRGAQAHQRAFDLRLKLQDYDDIRTMLPRAGA